MNLVQTIADGLWCVKAEQRFMGLHIGTQMTVVRLAAGGLLLHSPIPVTPALQAAIDALGPVRHIVCPNLFHHLHAGAAKAAWPQAQLHGPAALRDKRRDLRFDAVFGETPHADWVQDLEAVTIEGSLLGETVLFHRASRSLITVDLVENIHRCEHAPTRWYLKLGGTYRRAGWHPLLRLVYRDRAKARASVERILAWPFERILVAHGDNIVADPHRVLRDGLRWLL